MNIKTLFIFLSCFIESPIIFSQIPNNYSKFRNGTFFYTEMPKENFCVREHNSQKSYYPNGKINEYKVNWITDSTYILVFQKSNVEESLFQKGDTIFVKITAINKDCFEFLSMYKTKLYPPTWMCKKEE